MDHLKTTQERQHRWYAKDIIPNFVPIKEVNVDTIDAELYQVAHHDYTCSKGKEKSKVYVNGIPMTAIINPKAKEYMKLHLKEHGFVVVTRVLTLDECNHGLQKAWDYIEAASAAEQYCATLNHLPAKQQQHQQEDEESKNFHTSPIKRDDPSTYNLHFPSKVEGGILPFYGSGHTSFMWFLRAHPGVRTIFASIHDTSAEELSTSLDGIIAWIEPPSDRGWFHLDQNPTLKPGFESVQGLVNLLPVNEQTGGNVIIQKSHLMFPNHYIEPSAFDENEQSLFYQHRLKEIDGDDWLEIDQFDDVMLDPTKVISCLLGPGDVLIWDSRLVHCSYPPTGTSTTDQGNLRGDGISCRFIDDNHVPNRDESNEILALSMKEKYGLIRCAGLVNMIPRSKITQQVRYQRIQAIHHCRTLTHWVDKVSPLGEERSDEAVMETLRIDFMRKWQDTRSDDRDKVLLSFIDLSEEQKLLV